LPAKNSAFGTLITHRSRESGVSARFSAMMSILNGGP
jgi:hypothetical protein